MPRMSSEQLDRIHAEIERQRERERLQREREGAHLAGQERRHHALRANAARFAPWVRLLTGLGLAGLTLKLLWG